jgi:glycosyltransferase involved in cell wall biosynthesis
MGDEIHLWAPGLRGFGGGIGAFNRELAVALAATNPVRLAGKLDVSGLWRALPLRGSARVWNRVRTVHFAAAVAGMALRNRPRLVVAAHVHFSPLAYAIRRLLRTPYAVIAYGVEVGQHLSWGRLRALGRADSVWTISRWTRLRLLASGVPDERIRLVPPTVDDERFRVDKGGTELRFRHSIPSDAKVVLTVARLEASEGYKGCDRLLMALPAVRQAIGPVRYLVVGGGDERSRLEAQARALGVEGQVTFCGFVADDDLPEYYNLADAFAMPSTGEGFGIVFLEAMACGTPVLGGDADGSSDALADGELGALVNPDSTVAIADGIVQLLLRRGPSLWFDPTRLRARCLELHGREPFRRRVRDAVLSMNPCLPSNGSFARGSRPWPSGE